MEVIFEYGLGAAYRLLYGIGYDGCTRYSARLSIYHVMSVAAKADIARYQ
jgi:hypothetical protein